MRLGVEPKGIMGAGFVVSEPFQVESEGGDDKTYYSVMIDFEMILNPEKDEILGLEVLKTGSLSNVNWTPQGSGTEIDIEVVEELEAIWFDFLTSQKGDMNLTTDVEIENQNIYTEGSPNEVVTTRYERNPHARKACIDHYGTSCSVCTLDFGVTYGDLGKGFIHVHHLKQVASIGKKYRVDPIKDLRPVCPNCHAMLHKRKEPYTIEELKEIMHK